MCRTGGRGSPSSRTAAHGGTRGRSAAGQPGDTAPPGGTTPPPASSTPPPRPSGINYRGPNATVGAQYDHAVIGSITIGDSGIVIDGITGTPSAPLTPAQTTAAQHAADHATQAADTAAGGTSAGTARSGDSTAIQAGRIHIRNIQFGRGPGQP
ncbi:MAG TPA: hypothetical protein VGM53_31805 [Streptosporangiaceae bacterium]|jgi:hypothetical protein